MNHLRNILIILLLALLASCVSIEKAIKVATKNDANAEATQYALNQKHRLIVAENCASLFPVAESEVSPGKETTTEQEEETPGPVIPCEEGQQVECPPTKTVTRVTTRTDTIRVRDRAAEAALQEELKATRAELEQEREDKQEAIAARDKEIGEKTSSLNNWRGGVIVLGLIILGFVALKFLKPF